MVYIFSIKPRSSKQRQEIRFPWVALRLKAKEFDLTGKIFMGPVQFVNWHGFRVWCGNHWRWNWGLHSFRAFTAGLSYPGWDSRCSNEKRTRSDSTLSGNSWWWWWEECTVEEVETTQEQAPGLYSELSYIHVASNTQSKYLGGGIHRPGQAPGFSSPTPINRLSLVRELRCKPHSFHLLH